MKFLRRKKIDDHIDGILKWYIGKTRTYEPFKQMVEYRIPKNIIHMKTGMIDRLKNKGYEIETIHKEKDLIIIKWND
jgi:hypothetical protein